MDILRAQAKYVFNTLGPFNMLVDNKLVVIASQHLLNAKTWLVKIVDFHLSFEANVNGDKEYFTTYKTFSRPAEARHRQCVARAARGKPTSLRGARNTSAVGAAAVDRGAATAGVVAANGGAMVHRGLSEQNRLNHVR